MTNYFWISYNPVVQRMFNKVILYNGHSLFSSLMLAGAVTLQCCSSSQSNSIHYCRLQFQQGSVARFGATFEVFLNVSLDPRWLSWHHNMSLPHNSSWITYSTNETHVSDDIAGTIILVKRQTYFELHFTWIVSHIFEITYFIKEKQPQQTFEYH